MNRKIFFTTLLSCIFILGLNAQQHPNLNTQQYLRSGSLQIILSGSESVRLEIAGPMHFKETVSENIILSILMPGEYTVRISSLQRGGRNEVTINQIIRINSGQRTIARVSRNRLSTQSVIDENSQPVFSNNRPNSVPNNMHRLDFKIMDDLEFKQLCTSINSAKFDNDRLRLVSAVVEYVMFNTDQVKKMMSYFSFDDGKYNCVKTVIDKIYDRQNLYKLAEGFTYSSTKNKFFDLIKTKQ